MSEKFDKSLKVATKIYLTFVAISFFYGGIYTEMFVEGMGFSATNLALSFFGAFLAVIPTYLLGFIGAHMYYSYKEKKESTKKAKV